MQADTQKAAAEIEAGARAPEPPPTSLPVSRGKAIVREVAETIALFIVVFVVSQALLGNFVIEQESAKPNFLPGERILVDKMVYRATGLHRGDLVVTRSPRNGTEDLFKRVIGLPGERLQITVDNQVLIDGKPLGESYLPQGALSSRYGVKDVTLGPNEYFLMGDNRSNSQDSRAWGAITSDFLVGRAWLRYWPLNKLTLIGGTDYSSN